MTSLYGNIGGSRKAISYLYSNIEGSQKQLFPLYYWERYKLNKYENNMDNHSNNAKFGSGGSYYVEYMTAEFSTQYSFDGTNGYFYTTNNIETITRNYGDDYYEKEFIFYENDIYLVIFRKGWVSRRRMYHFVKDQDDSYLRIRLTMHTYYSENTADHSWSFTINPLDDTMCYYCDGEELSTPTKGDYIGQVTSTDRSRYPDNGISGSYWYVFVS